MNLFYYKISQNIKKTKKINYFATKLYEIQYVYMLNLKYIHIGI